ncbi:MAG: DUF4115 domain-containing protein [Gammaproteobacteria bacterium]|nr:DUF4115 domain-containing protein [Gammaproteobacteria bacterium]
MSNTAEVQADSVGALLRQSREQKGLTTAEVATRLRLKTSQIEQIEAEDWDPAVSVTFMRGYLRAYARLLKLPEKEILQNFELQAAYLRNQAKPMHSFSKKNRLDAVDNRFMLATYLLVVLLIGLFLVWFWQTHILDSQPVSVVPEYRISGDESSDVNTSIQPTSVLPAIVNDQGASVTQSSEPSESVSVEVTMPTESSTVVEQPLTLESETQGTTNQLKPTTDAAPVTDSQASEGANASADSANPVNDQRITNTDATPTPAAASVEVQTASDVVRTGQLDLTFSEQCWVTVEDATGKRLAYGMKSAGQSLQLTGQLPLRLTLGNAAAATVQLNQMAVDLSGYRAGQVARLTLDGQL